MKILHILHELKFSGAEIMYVDAAPVFQELGCELSVVATAENLGEYAPYFKEAGYKVYHKPYPKFKHLISRIIFIVRFIQFLKNKRIDVVHNHSSGTFWTMAFCAWITGKKSVYTFHSVFPTHFYSYFYHCLLRWSAKNIFNCQFQTISDSVYDHELRLYHNQTSKIYNWYGSNRFYPASNNEKTQKRAELKLPPNSFILISVGGCNLNKRHSDIIKALPLILKYIPNCFYLHLGRGESEQDEMNLVAQLGINNHVLFCSNQTDVRKYLIVSDLYLMTSQYEGIPITTIEAMACKIPAILYDVSGLRDFNKNGENSILILEDCKMLSESVIQLSENEINRNTISENAYNFVKSTFNMERNAKLIFDLYQTKNQ